MAGEVIEFVDSVSASATVRLSLTTAPWRVIMEGTSVPPPPLRRAVAQTLLADGGYIPASAYDNRIITLRLQYKGTAGPASATAVQVLNRELNRETNILRWQPDNTLPAVYFRTFRSPDYDPQTDHGLDLFQMTVQITAEPFALGLPVTVTPATVSNDPAAGSNGKFFDITSPSGDVETPLLLKIPGSYTHTKQSLFAVRRRGTPSSAPYLLQVESMTQGTDTATAAGGATFSGSTTNSSTCTFSTTTTLAQRLSTVFPSSPSVDARGQYRVFLRCVGANTSSVFGIVLRHGSRQISNTEATLSQGAFGTSFITMVDLGLIQLPEGFDPTTDGPTGVAMPVVGVNVAVDARRISGTGSLLMDYLLFVPADDCLSIVKWGNATPTNHVFNGYSMSVYGLNGSDQMQDIVSAAIVGGPPLISPGVTNRIYFVGDVSPLNVIADTVSTTVAIAPFYWPRYLSIRPTST